jgi:hypothetical protein
MILHLMKCEMCDATHQFEPMMGHALSQMPRDWLSLHSGDRSEEGYLFCSSDCLKKHLGVGESTQPLEQPATKMRRFLLVDGETADETEGVKWSNGHVSLDPEKCKTDDDWFYINWDQLKKYCPGCGVTWIDEEVSDVS